MFIFLILFWFNRFGKNAKTPFAQSVQPSHARQNCSNLVSNGIACAHMSSQWKLTANSKEDAFSLIYGVARPLSLKKVSGAVK
jgi:hypothetical protein